MQLQIAPSGVDPAVWREPDLVAVVDSANLPSAVVLSYSFVRSNGRSGGEERNRFDNECVAKMVTDSKSNESIFR